MTGRIHRAPLFLVALIIVVIGAGGGAGVYFAADRLESGITRIDVRLGPFDESANDDPAENFLIVGSDSRENFNPEAESTDPGCKCSDTLMVLRRTPDEGAVLLSVPRDTWVNVVGYGDAKINSAYSHGADVLVDTVRTEFQITIDHYIEVDFAGFRDLVDAIGGVEICTDFLAQDRHTGMRLEPGCSNVNGEGALSYARSRYYEEFIDGEWVPDNRYDFGRIERQQKFIETAVAKLSAEIIANPDRLGDLIEVAKRAIKLDSQTDILKIAPALAAAARASLQTITLPTEREIIDDQDSQLVTPAAEPILAYFRGAGPLPPVASEPADTTA